MLSQLYSTCVVWDLVDTWRLTCWPSVPNMWYCNTFAKLSSKAQAWLESGSLMRIENCNHLQSNALRVLKLSAKQRSQIQCRSSSNNPSSKIKAFPRGVMFANNWSFLNCYQYECNVSRQLSKLSIVNCGNQIVKCQLWKLTRGI